MGRERDHNSYASYSNRQRSTYIHMYLPKPFNLLLMAMTPSSSVNHINAVLTHSCLRITQLLNHVHTIYNCPTTSLPILILFHQAQTDRNRAGWDTEYVHVVHTHAHTHRRHKSNTTFTHHATHRSPPLPPTPSPYTYTLTSCAFTSWSCL